MTDSPPLTSSMRLLYSQTGVNPKSFSVGYDVALLWQHCASGGLLFFSLVNYEELRNNKIQDFKSSMFMSKYREPKVQNNSHSIAVMLACNCSIEVASLSALIVSIYEWDILSLRLKLVVE